jgi:hypothetical protein
VVLDANLPNEYVAEVLANVSGTLYLGIDGWLRSRRHSSTDRPMSFLEVFHRYGDVIEEVLEFGSVSV